MPDKLSPDRKERLAAAKKKLKHFQQHRHPDEFAHSKSSTTKFSAYHQQRPLSATLSTSSTESLAESSKSMDHRHLSARYSDGIENFDRKRFSIDANAVNFSHDDARSPFQRVLQKPLHENFNIQNSFENQNLTLHQIPYRMERSELDSGDSTPKPFRPNDVYYSHPNFVEAIPADQCNKNALVNENSTGMREENEQLRQYCTHVTAQFEELNRNYAILHAAYSSLPEFGGQKIAQHIDQPHLEPFSGEIVMLNQQLQQNMQTMSVLIEEKSDLQSQLRQAMDIANSKNRENEDLQVRLKEAKTRLTAAEHQRDVSGATNLAVEASFERQTEELIRMRPELAQAQARASESVQDKSEAQAKLKLRSKECDALQKSLLETEGRLAANQIYLRQLTGNGATPQPVEAAFGDNQFKLENDRLESDLNELRQNCDRLKWENDQSKERYEIYGRQLNQKLIELTEDNEKLFKQKIDLEKSVNDFMQEKNLKLQIGDVTEEKVQENLRDAVQKMHFELMELKPKMNIMMHERDVLQGQLDEKASIIADLEQNVTEKGGHISKLNEHLNAVTLADSNTKSLLEQLHNEKATSSRSVAQNLTLKQQLVEIEEKFVAVTNDQMENASLLQTAQHSLHILENQLAEKTSEIEVMKQVHAEECNKLKTQVNSVLRHEYDRRQLEDRLEHYEVAYKAAIDESARLKNQLETLLAENLYWHEKASALDQQSHNTRHLNNQASSGEGINRNEPIGDDSNRSGPINDGADFGRPISDEGAELIPVRYADWPTSSAVMNNTDESGREISLLKNELQETSQVLRRISAENAELRSIMDQNSTDENQNTIRVELNRAVERLSLLVEENEQLRRTVEEVNSQPKQFQRPEISNDDQSSVCSEHAEHRRDTVSNEAFGNLKQFMEQLQERLKRAVDQNADLSDKNEQLEHLIVKLQSETETIGEYVTLYRHQRQLIRDKLKEKEGYVAQLSHENASIQAKLSELQDLVVNLMKERGTLISYPLAQAPIRHPPPRSPPSKPTPRPHNLSETLVDEVTGGTIRTFSKSPSLCSEAIELEPHDSNYDQRTEDHVTTISTRHIDVEEQQKNPQIEKHQSGTADRILQILSELQKPGFSRNLKPYERDIHCKHCTGHMITL